MFPHRGVWKASNSYNWFGMALIGIDNPSRYRQSLKEATESLLKATKATGLLADATADIRAEKNKRSSGTSTSPTTGDIPNRETPISSINELHKSISEFNAVAARWSGSAPPCYSSSVHF